MQAKSLRIFAIAVLLIGCFSAVAFAGVTKSLSMTNAQAKTASCAVVKAGVVKSQTPIATAMTKGHSVGKLVAMSPKTKSVAGGKVKARILAR
jgi:hypothetical protein